MPIIVEAAVETVDAAVGAAQAGADRLELCADLEHGGTTPSLRLIHAVRAATDLPVYVMVRPRPGNFVYSKDEIALMVKAIELICTSEPSGIVTGAIGADRRLDMASTRSLATTARTMSVTFHRAFDDLAEPLDALDQLIQLGVSRILTAGGSPTAHEGVERIAALVKRACGRITIIAGGDVRAHNVREIIARTGVSEVHARFVDYAQMRDLVAAARD